MDHKNLKELLESQMIHLLDNEKLYTEIHRACMKDADPRKEPEKDETDCGLHTKNSMDYMDDPNTPDMSDDSYEYFKGDDPGYEKRAGDVYYIDKAWTGMLHDCPLRPQCWYRRKKPPTQLRGQVSVRSHNPEVQAKIDAEWWEEWGQEKLAWLNNSTSLSLEEFAEKIIERVKGGR